MPRTTDVAIVGGGVIGCSIAYHLAKLGIKSTVFEQRRLASGASGATAGVVGPLWHIEEFSRATLELGLRSLDTFPKLAQELVEAGGDPEFRQTGLLWIALDEEDVRTLQQGLAWQGELGLGVRWLERDAVLQREPHVNPQVQGGVLSPNEGHVRGQAYVGSLAHAASRLGAVIREGVEVGGLEIDGDTVTGVRTTTDTYYADHTVLAAGPWTGIQGRWLPEGLPVRPVKGQRILLRRAGLVPHSPVHGSGGYVIPQVDGSLLVAATREESLFDQTITADAITAMVARAVSIFPALDDAEFVSARAGVRPGSPDGVPIIGPVPGWNGLSIASGHDHVGIMLSPGTGELMANYIGTGDATPLEPFSPARFVS